METAGKNTHEAMLNPRLARLTRLIRELTDDEMRALPVVLGDAIFALERQRAKSLEAHIGERCDVIWPGQAEMLDVRLASVDIETAIVRVETSVGRGGCEVPPYTVVLRD